jgi:hypothetical protein
MPSQFPISSPCPFERNKGIGCGSIYYGYSHGVFKIGHWSPINVTKPKKWM